MLGILPKWFGGSVCAPGVCAPLECVRFSSLARVTAGTATHSRISNLTRASYSVLDLDGPAEHCSFSEDSVSSLEMPSPSDIVPLSVRAC